MTQTSKPDGGRVADVNFIPADTAPDLTNCDREPIHIPGSIQPVGFLIATSSDWVVTYVSANITDHLGHAPEDLLGEQLERVITEPAFHAIREQIQLVSQPDAVERLSRIPLRSTGGAYDLTVHIAEDNIVIEAEPSGEKDAGDPSALVRGMIGRVGKARSLEDMCMLAARQVKAMTGFDRAMIYRFDESGAGEVIAEAREPHLEAFLNLHYPASDIPRQARVLYKRNLVRSISDVNMDVVPVVPQQDPSGKPLDMSLCSLRAVSPIHLEYLRNMGVGASFSISIIVRGELWGLIACHHYSPHHLDPNHRSMAELYGQILSLMIERRERDTERLNDAKARMVHDRLMAQLSGSTSIFAHFEDISDLLAEIIPHHGMAVWIDGECRLSGRTPSQEEIAGLVKFLNRATVSRVYETRDIGSVYERGRDFIDRAAGLMAIPVSRQPRDYLILFRHEIARSVTWAGNPEKPVDTGPNGVRLTPRKSFEAWQETVTGQSAPWQPEERAAAESIRVTFLEVILRMSDAAEKEKTRSNERQELLIAELNHRVRNILNLIKSLVNQSRSHASSVNGFAETISGRIQALARAHDQVTAQHWGPGSLRELLLTEAAAYASEKSNRLAYSGTDVMFRPTALTTLALVIHELMTNSMKYGALSDSSGHIDVEVKEQADGSIEICWQEKGGPAVQPPEAKGFGSTIIERSIPFELGGEAELDYRVAGLVARLVIPARHVSELTEQTEDADAPQHLAAQQNTEAVAVPGKSALVVEDNAIIAMDAEDMLKELGASTVSVRTNCESALSEIERQAPDFALLDINLGSETSEPIAARLNKLGIPFVFATGYGDRTDLTGAYPQAPVISKPYHTETLREALARVDNAETDE